MNPASTRTNLAAGNRPIFAAAVDATGNPTTPGSPLAFFLPVIREAIENAQPPQVVARAFRQMLELSSPYPNVFAVIPSGPDSTAEAATLSLMLATQEKEELQLGADALGCQP